MTSRDDTIWTIRQALKARSGKTWSVTGGRGTAWGWIRVMSPPARRQDFGNMSDADRAELAQLLNLDTVDYQGESIPGSSAYYAEYIARAKGETPAALAQPYWD